ncbi:CD40 ligand [Hemicordylus capensis]|uniref:CD40 ligand n=1 Tax=Hemicordylus capensis TaxID=884348 RepID=UPI002303D38B|nr:CD40 ligand [Hemicordylus capensis]
MDSSESYSPSAPRPAGRTVTMKTFLSLIVVFVITQLLGTVLFGLYLHMKLDKMGEEISLREDFVFLKKLQKCRKPQDADASLLDCTKILNIFRELQAQTSPIKEEVSRALTGDKKPSATIHLAGLRGSRKVLQWKEAVYAPSMDDEFSYQDGKLTINKGGRYYIYSQVAFCAKQEQHLPKQMPPFSVYMYLNLPSESDRLLLKGVGTHGNSDDLCDLQSIYLGRVVELQKGHVIFVNVTDSSRVNYDHGNTYFGMFELS